ncbi:serine hydrolase [Arthrobacter sp. TB 23]|uniref:serine hydrolase n=1 Tax=Arthrobacter sp. TB 23 TaxID=494419 RepID=UPI0002E1B1D0|nr:serine hydrolase [Arthrobacter sp. TB 23]
MLPEVTETPNIGLLRCRRVVPATTRSNHLGGHHEEVCVPACTCIVVRQCGVAIADTSGDNARLFGEESAFFAASTAKIITAAAFYHSVEDGEASLDENLGKEDAGFQIQDMVNNSDNNAWLLLMQSVGYPELTDYAESLGVAYDPEENLLTTADMARVLTMLHEGELLNRENTAQLLGYMQETNNEELIPAGASPVVTVHHKYGLIGSDLHDAALLTHGDSTVALVIYTKNTGDGSEADQIQLIRSLTRAAEDALFAADS